MLRWIASLVLVCAATTASAFSLGSRHALVIDAQSGEVLLEKSSDAVVPIASLTKLMTSMVVLDAQPDMDEAIEITDEDVDTLKHSSSRVPVGAVLPRRTLLELALMSSDNRAAHALARTYPGGMQAFLDHVYAKQEEIGMEHTVLIEPTGLSPENRSTAQDVAKMAMAASNYPQIRQITTSSADDIEINGADRAFHNTNRLVGNSRWDILLSKTGYTREAGRCIVMHIQTAGRNAIMVLLNASETVTRTADAIKLRSVVDGSPFVETSFAAPMAKPRMHRIMAKLKGHQRVSAKHAQSVERHRTGGASRKRHARKH